MICVLSVRLYSEDPPTNRNDNVPCTSLIGVIQACAGTSFKMNLRWFFSRPIVFVRLRFITDMTISVAIPWALRHSKSSFHWWVWRSVKAEQKSWTEICRGLPLFALVLIPCLVSIKRYKTTDLNSWLKISFKKKCTVLSGGAKSGQNVIQLSLPLRPLEKTFALI